MRPFLAVALFAALGTSQASPTSYESVREIHVLAGSTRTTLRLSGDRVLTRAARSRSSGDPVRVPRRPLEVPDRVVWLVGPRIRTRVAYVEGVEVERRSFELKSGRELRPPFHLFLPGALAPESPVPSPAPAAPSAPGARPPPLYVDAPAPEAYSPGSVRDPEPARPRSVEAPAASREVRVRFDEAGDGSVAGAAPAYPAAPAAATAPAAGEGDLFGFDSDTADFPEGDGAYVGAAQDAAALFGEDLGGLLDAEDERPRPLEIHGYVETLIMGGEDGPSAHALETGLMGNRAIETKEVVFNLEAALGRDVTFFGQIRAVRFNRFDHRMAMLRIGDSKDEHWTFGRQISPFGRFPARNLSTQNPLYGYPIPYFYRTSLSAATAPTSLAGVLAGRGLGPGMGQAGPSLYQTYALRHAHLGRKGRLVYGLQNGAQSNAENVTQNDDFGFIARASISPTVAWTLGLSGSVAGYLQQGATGLAQGENPEDFDQQLLGFDLEFARGKWRVFAEGLWSDWDVSSLMNVGGSLGSFGWYLEGTYQASPKLFVAGRYSTIEFDEVPNGAGGQTPWDFDADRFEIGVGYRPTINVLAKLSGQTNDTETTPDPDDDVVVFQLIGSF
jgi:hypothetical protein